jgi:hypothetical protein
MVQVADHALLRQIIRLCEFGARPPVILALLHNANEAQVRQIWEQVQGHRSPRGKIAHTYRFFFTTHARKLQSAFIASAYSSLIASGVHYVDAYITAYEIYMEQFPEQQISFDRAWHLMRSVTTHEILMLNCGICSSSYVLPRDAMADDREHCPVCNHNNASVAGSLSKSVDFESRFVKAGDDAANLKMIERVTALVKLGARPPSIKSLIQNVPDALIRQYWIDIHGQRPPQGPLPSKSEWYFQSYERRMQAATVLSTHRMLVDQGIHHVDAYIKAYELYLEMFEDRQFNFDRLWHLMRDINIKNILVESCSRCNSTYLRLRDDLARDSHCAACRLTVQTRAVVQPSKAMSTGKPFVPVKRSIIRISPKNADLTE